MAATRRFFQFRLRDLFALVTLLAIFLAVGLPYLHKAREQARMEACRNTLRNVGVALHSFANLDPQGRYGTGQSDYLQTGCPDSVGWMADVITIEPALRGKLFCAVNPTAGWEGVNELYTGGSGKPSPIAQLSAGFCGAPDWKNALAGPGPDFAGSLPQTPERASLIARATWGSGFNTNYTPSWFLTCGEVRYTFATSGGITRVMTDSDPAVGPKPGEIGAWKVAASAGPLTRRTIYGCVSPSSIIPLMGDGAPSAKLGFDMEFGAQLANRSADPLDDRTSRRFARRGDLLVSSTTRGPVKWHATTKSLRWIAVGDDFTDQLGAERTRSDPRLSGSDHFLQDTRGWRSWHRIAGNSYCNLLMADGSVACIWDQNGDGLLNPGFPIPSGLTEEEYRRIGYRDGTTELEPDTVFSGMFIYFRRPRFE